ncbi:hypothetical protein ACQ4M3_11545 [Leptolyngbya sp. AN03gr2]|uniref:hypothetical protein n=1 Tax=unclassified Leptolyngbya TaxID=2650499 RepID=UPI003D3214DC
MSVTRSVKQKNFSEAGYVIPESQNPSNSMLMLLAQLQGSSSQYIGAAEISTAEM